MALSVPIASFQANLSSKISSSATTIPISKTTDDDGNTMDTKVLFYVIDKGTPSEEFVKGTMDDAGAQLTSVIRGISVTDGSTAVAALQSLHRKNAPIEISDHPYLVLAMRVLNGTDEMGGVMKLPASRVISDSRHVADKEYVDLVATTAGGISAFATADEGGINIGVGSGYLVTPDGTVVYAGDTGFALTDDATNYIELTLGGVLVANTTGFTTGYVPVAIVTTVSGDITVNTDARGWLTAPSGDVLSTDDVTYGASIGPLDVLYNDTSDGKWKLADASAEATADGQLSIAIDIGVDTDTGKRVQVGGLVTGLVGLTAGWVYLSDTAGDLSATPGTYKRIVGWAINATTMFLVPAFSADEFTGGNSDLTVAILNEAATFFANTAATGAELEELTDGSTIDPTVSSGHRHKVYDNQTDDSTFVSLVIKPSDMDLTDAGASTTKLQNAVLAHILTVGTPTGTQFSITGTQSHPWLTTAGKDFRMKFWAKFDDNAGGGDSVGCVGAFNTVADVIDLVAAASKGLIRVAYESGALEFQTASDLNAGRTVEAVAGITATNWNEYEIILTFGTDAVLKVNGVVKNTISTNLPTSDVLNVFASGASGDNSPNTLSELWHTPIYLELGL